MLICIFTYCHHFKCVQKLESLGEWEILSNEIRSKNLPNQGHNASILTEFIYTLEWKALWQLCAQYKKRDLTRHTFECHCGEMNTRNGISIWNLSIWGFEFRFKSSQCHRFGLPCSCSVCYPKKKYPKVDVCAFKESNDHSHLRLIHQADRLFFEFSSHTE